LNQTQERSHGKEVTIAPSYLGSAMLETHVRLRHQENGGSELVLFLNVSYRQIAPTKNQLSDDTTISAVVETQVALLGAKIY